MRAEGSVVVAELYLKCFFVLFFLQLLALDSESTELQKDFFLALFFFLGSADKGVLSI